MAAILIVDDNPKLLQLLQRTLTHEGLSVRVAADSKGPRASGPDVATLDWPSSEPDRISVLDRLRAAGENKLVLMIAERDAVETRGDGLAYADLYLDLVTRDAWRGGRAFDLTTKEFDLLCYLLRRPREVLRRKQILQDVWGANFSGDENVLEVYIGYLRKKMEAGREPRLIQTVRGVGYVLREE